MLQQRFACLLGNWVRRIPQPCALCGDLPADTGLCDGCRQDLPVLPTTHCPVCAAPQGGTEICGRCLRHPPAFDAIFAAHLYAFPVNSLIRQLKFHGALALADLLGRGLLAAARDLPRPDVIVPMPLAAHRLRIRGFNQAHEIARPVARALGVRLEAGACLRVRDTPEQSGLSLAARRANLRNAFVCAPRFDGTSVVVIDDVVTSGATMDALARALKRAGARQVRGWVVARTPARGVAAPTPARGRVSA